MNRDTLPEPWRSALERKGISSMRGLAAKAGVSPQTAKRLIDGTGMPSYNTIVAIADAVFDGDRGYVWELAGVERQDFGDFQLPPEASQLDPEQRAAVLAVVKAMLPRAEGGGLGGNTAPTRIGRPYEVESSGPYRSAARRPGTPSAGQRRRQEYDEAGEESQDY